METTHKPEHQVQVYSHDSLPKGHYLPEDNKRPPNTKGQSDLEYYDDDEDRDSDWYDEDYEDPPWPCLKTRKRKRITICVITSSLVLGLILFFIWPRAFEIDNKSLNAQLDRQTVGDQEVISGVNVAMELYNPNFVTIEMSALDFKIEGVELDLNMHIRAVDASEVIVIPSFEKNTYNVNVNGTVNINNIGAALDCLGDSGSLLVNMKGTVVLKHPPFFDGKIDIDRKDVERECLG